MFKIITKDIVCCNFTTIEKRKRELVAELVIDSGVTKIVWARHYENYEHLEEDYCKIINAIESNVNFVRL